ncbi:hypothetical protein D3C80_1320230 [compost metagenome]
MDGAHTLPVLAEESGGVRLDLDHFTGLVDVRAATFEKVAELVAGDMAEPLARGADPDTAFGLAFRPFVQHHAGYTGLTFKHGRDHAPILDVGDAQRVVQKRGSHVLLSRLCVCV